MTENAQLLYIPQAVNASGPRFSVFSKSDKSDISGIRNTSNNADDGSAKATLGNLALCEYDNIFRDSSSVSLSLYSPRLPVEQHPRLSASSKVYGVM